MTVAPIKHESPQSEIRAYRERVEEDAEEEEDEEEDDEEDDGPLEAPPQDVPERLVGGGEPQEGRLWTSGRKQEVERLCTGSLLEVWLLCKEPVSCYSWSSDFLSALDEMMSVGQLKVSEQPHCVKTELLVRSCVLQQI